MKFVSIISSMFDSFASVVVRRIDIVVKMFLKKIAISLVLVQIAIAMSVVTILFLSLALFFYIIGYPDFTTGALWTALTTGLLSIALVPVLLKTIKS